MDISLKQSIRNSLVITGIMWAFSFFYGALYNEMILQKQGITLLNLFYGLLGSGFITILIFFIPTFVISLIWFYFKPPFKKMKA